MLRRFIPSTLIGRSIIIIFVPIIVLVLITALVFYQTSWNIISKRLAESVAADISVIIKLIDSDFEKNELRKVDVQITRLRQKLEINPKQPKYIKTIRGKGYKLICKELS